MAKSNKIKEIKEPWIKASIFSPESFIGAIMQLCTEKEFKKKLILRGNRVY